MSGPSDAQKTVEAFRGRMNTLDDRLASSMMRSYAPVYKQLTKEMEDLVRKGAARNLKPWEIMRSKRLKDIERQFLSRMDEFAIAGGDLITNGQRTAVGLARSGAGETVASALPNGVTMDNLANIGLEWNRLPDDAFSNFIGMAADGKPVGRLLKPLGPAAAKEVRGAIGTGIAMGKGPRATARLIETAAGMPLTRALLITRTETNRAFREASRLEYASSPVVKGYRRMAAKTERTCMACIALDGTLYDLNEPLNEHPNGRCTMVPEVLDYADLGLDVPRFQGPPEDARFWFANQDEKLQRKILGPERLRAYKAGELDLSQLYQVKSNPVWGDTAGINPIKNITTKSGTKLDEWIEFDKIVQPERVKRKIKPPKVVSKVVKPAKTRFDDAGQTLNKMATPERVPEIGKAHFTPEEFAQMTTQQQKDALADVGGKVLGDIAKRDDIFARNLDLVEKNRRTLAQTPAGQELDGAIQAWSSGGNENMRVGARKWMKGDERLTRGNVGQENGARLAEAVSNGEQFNQPLHRGVRAFGEPIDKMEELYPKGKVYDAHISSFSTDTQLAESFAGSGVQAQDTSIIFNLEPGAKGLNIESVSTFFGERERIIAGRFEVIGTRRVRVGTGRRAGEVLHVDIRQINTLVKEVK